jgi:hypothetical protein
MKIDGFEKLAEIEKLINEGDSEFVSINREDLKFYYQVFLNTLMTMGRMSEQGFGLIQEKWELEYKLKEVRKIKPLVWDKSNMDRGFPATTKTILGNFSAWEISGDGFWMLDGMRAGRFAGKTLQSALDAVQEMYEKEIRKIFSEE